MTGQFRYDLFYNVHRLSESHNINYKLVFSGGSDFSMKFNRVIGPGSIDHLFKTWPIKPRIYGFLPMWWSVT